MDDYPDRRTTVGRVNVDLWKGLLRDEVRVWIDVRPALGGLLGRRTCWRGRGRGEDLHDSVVAMVEGACE